MEFFLPRTCREYGRIVEQADPRRIDELRNIDAYVLLGDPGAGKTSLLAREADESGGLFVSARDFLTLEFNEPIAGKTLFIDGLDETRAGVGDFRSPLDRLRTKLDELGRPRFRLSCREADWLGASDQQALARVSTNGQLKIFQLDPLTEEQIVLFLDHLIGPDKGQVFVETATSHGLDGLLGNPQTLKLLAEALRADRWPVSRCEVFELACRQLVSESNREHRAAKRTQPILNETLLDAAGYLGTLMLLADRPSATYDTADFESVSLRDLEPAPPLPFDEALRTRLFQSTKEGHFSFVHRSVAEFLAGRFIGVAVDEGRIPMDRVMSLMIGTDAGVVSGLRGMHAWIAALGKSHRLSQTERDPLGVVLYGDVRVFSTSEKQFLLSALSRQAEEYSGFRWQDWSSSPFGALSTKDMTPVFHEILTSSERDEAHQAFVNCVLDALNWGGTIPELADTLLAIVRDSSYWSINRRTALDIFVKTSETAHEELANVAKAINTGQIDDDNDELIGKLLTVLYPEHIGPNSVLDFLHPEKEKHLLGSYMMFWGYELAGNSDSKQISDLLDCIVEAKIDWHGQRHEYLIKKFLGEVLCRGVEECGDTTSDKRITQWLGIGLDKYHHSTLENEHQNRIQSWLACHPDRYKAVLGELLPQCKESDRIRYCFFKIRRRLYGADQPSDLGLWFLEQSDNYADDGLKRQCFEEAVGCLVENHGADGMSLEYLYTWLESRPALTPVLAELLQSEIPDWRLEQAQQMVRQALEKSQRIEDSNQSLREVQERIREGTAQVQTLHYLANGYFGRYYECSGDTNTEKLSSILAGDAELIGSALEGFRNTLSRDDLPTLEQIAKTNAEGKIHYVSTPCLAGALEISRNDPEAILTLSDEVLSRLVCFSYSDGGGDTPGWLECLHKHRPDLVSLALVQHATVLLRKQAQHVSYLYSLAHDSSAAEIAKRSTLPLLKQFRVDARKHQASLLEYLLKAAIQHSDRTELRKLTVYKLQSARMSIWQQTYWIACGFALGFDGFSDKFCDFIGGNLKRAQCAVSFLGGDREFQVAAGVSDDLIVSMIQVLAPFFQPHTTARSGKVTQDMRATEFIQSLITQLSNSTSDSVSSMIENMLSTNSLTNWHQQLKHALFTHQVNRRETLFVHPTLEQVQKSISNGQPANPADLASLTYSILKDISKHIRDGSTDLYKQFWNTDSHRRPTEPRVEDVCRDLLLELLRERIKQFGVDAQREGSYADEGRADIRVSFGGVSGFNVPVEAKRDKHRDVWTAMHDELIRQYARDPGAAGFGIYLVFWFNTGMAPPPGDRLKPTSAREMEEELTDLLSTEERRFIKVIVIDVEKT